MKCKKRNYLPPPTGNENIIQKKEKEEFIEASAFAIFS